MNEQDLKINLGAVEETLVIPLWARAKDAEKNDPIVNDTCARDIVAKIDYDFSKIETRYMENHQLVWSIRAYNFDNCVRDFLKNNEKSMVVNIGAGLDTAFKRVDDGSVLWVNIEMPNVAALRQKLIPDSEREKTIAKSVLDFTWMDDIAQKTQDRSLLLMAAGVLCYFEPNEVEILLKKLADSYPSAFVLFDAMSRFTVWFSNRAIIKKSGMDSSARLKWHLKKASHLRRWVDTIKIIEEYPMFSRVPIKQEWSKKLVRDIKIAGRLRLYNMVLVQL
ncbi:MAG: class I SAM-dependent methyltransferase [Candidatus Aminicenantes bacterium]|nr:MAG: class I SAM-dependent methyltransferase [Candidatus Aminicenantes bacterium]